MTIILWLVGSVTTAMRGRELLNQHGFSAYIEKLPRDLKSSGCGYGIYVTEKPERAEEILLRSGFSIKKRVPMDFKPEKGERG